MISFVAFAVILQQPQSLPILIVTDRTIDPAEVKQITENADPQGVLKEKGYKLRTTAQAVYARVPDIFRLDTAADRIAAARELAFAARRTDQSIKVKELSPEAVRGLLLLSEESFTEDQRALLFRGDTTIHLRSSATVFATISGKRVIGTLGQPQKGSETANEPPTEAELKSVRSFRPSPSRAFSKLEFLFLRPGNSDVMMDYCAEESQKLAEELRAQNKLLADARTNLSIASGMHDQFKVNETVGRYPELKTRMEETARSTYQQYGFSSFKEVADGLNTAKIDMVRASIIVRIVIKGAATQGSFQLTPRRY